MQWNFDCHNQPIGSETELDRYKNRPDLWSIGQYYTHVQKDPWNVCEIFYNEKIEYSYRKRLEDVTVRGYMRMRLRQEIIIH